MQALLLLWLKDVQKGVEACLENGKRLIDDARLLQQQGRYLSSIPLYILGYEEVGKGLFLAKKLIRKHKIHEKEWHRLTQSPKAHERKVRMDFEHVLETQLSMTKQDFQTIQDWAKRTNRYFLDENYDVPTIVYRTTRTIMIMEKLPILKEACFYMDYFAGEWYNINRFPSHILWNICEYFYYEFMRAYVKANIWIFKLSIGIRKRKQKWTPEQMALFEKNEYVKKLNEIYGVYHQSAYMKSRDTALAAIEVIVNSYSYKLLKENRERL